MIIQRIVLIYFSLYSNTDFSRNILMYLERVTTYFPCKEEEVSFA